MNRLIVLSNILNECGINATDKQITQILEKLESNPITNTNPDSVLAATRMIRARRESLGIPQIEIGRLIGVSDTTIQTYEGNKYLKTSVSDIATILRYLNKKEIEKQNSNIKI